MIKNRIRSLALMLGFAVSAAADLAASLLLDGIAIAGATDWIPSTDAAKQAFANIFAAGLTANPGNYGLTAPDAATFQALADSYSDAYDMSVDPATRTAVTIAAKDAAKNLMIPAMRALGNTIQANVAVSDDDKTAIGLTIRSTGAGSQTDIVAPTSFPLISILSATPLALNLKITDSDTPDSKAKPVGAWACELYVQPSATPIVDPEAIKYSGLETEHLTQLQFASGDVGKQAYFVGRWVTRKGLHGPWSEIGNFTVAA